VIYFFRFVFFFARVRVRVVGVGVVGVVSGLGFGLSARAPGGAPLDLVRFVLYCLPIRIHTFGSFEKLNGSTDQTRASFANETTGSKGKDYRRCPR